MLTLGGRGLGGAEPWGALVGGLVRPPLEKADHGQKEAAEDGAEAEAQRAVDQGPLVGAQPQPWGRYKTVGGPEFRGFPAFPKVSLLRPAAPALQSFFFLIRAHTSMG